MSIRVMSRVWAESKHKEGTLLILLAIADFADDNGVAYPAMATLAVKARMTTRNAQLAVRRLTRAGELRVDVGAGPRGCNLFRVSLATGVQLALGGGEKSDTKGVKPASSEPSLEPSLEPSHVGTGAPEARTDQEQTQPRTLTPAQEAKLIVNATVDRWRELRRRHFAGRGHFDDPQAIAGLKKAVVRALAAGCTAGDLSAGLLAHGDDPKGNPWYADEWANRERAIREEEQARTFKAQDRRAADRVAQQADEAKWQALEAAHPGMTRGEIAKAMLRRDRGFQHVGAAIDRVLQQAASR